MVRKTVTGIVASLAVVMVLGASAFATDITAATGNITPFGSPTMAFKTSPSVYVDYHSPGATTANVSYVAGSVHAQGDRAYGVDPDYTGMYVQSVTAGQTSVPNFPATSAASSTGDFPGASTLWVPK